MIFQKTGKSIFQSKLIYRVLFEIKVKISKKVKVTIQKLKVELKSHKFSFN